jgi:protein-tyrosine-phosphatase
MAAAFAQRYGTNASSAGTAPAPAVNPTVVAVMKEKGIDLSRAKPRMLLTEMIEQADVVVTMGCSVEEVCPAPLIARMQKKLVEWKLEDPKNLPAEKVREIRDGIDRKVKHLLL